MSLRRLIHVACAGLLAATLLAGSLVAQEASEETLADIRQQLFDIYAQMEGLRLQLRPSGGADQPGRQTGEAVSPSAQRLDELEAELRQVLARVEELEFRIIRIAEDGARQIRDLEFRLVELGGGDLSSLGPATILGGEPAEIEAEDAGIGSVGLPSDLPSGEQEVFDRAMAAFEIGEFAEATRLFEEFSDQFAISSLNADAHYYRGMSESRLGNMTAAARAYLESYRAEPEMDSAPRALVGLGSALEQLGQIAEACRVYKEVLVAFPLTGHAATADIEGKRLECN